MESFLA